MRVVLDDGEWCIIHWMLDVVSVCFLVNWRVLLSSWRSVLLVNLTDETDLVKLTWSSSVRLFLPRGPGVRTVLYLGILVWKMVSCLPALCLPVGARLFPLICESTDGWYSLADAAGADDDGGSGRITS